jgi:aminoglycoside phosphotransferase (APT) family kinase protein
MGTAAGIAAVRRAKRGTDGVAGGGAGDESLPVCLFGFAVAHAYAGHTERACVLVPHPDDYVKDAEQVAEVIARLHEMTAPEDLCLPALEPFRNAGQRIAESRWLTEDDRTWMTSELARLQAEYARLDFALPPGVIHGDANIVNVLRDDHGNPVVIDLDDFATGPREWDLIQTAIYCDHFGWHTREEYEIFTRVYGYDLLQWPGYPVLAAVREFIMVTWMILKADESDRTSDEARKRINALRSGTSRKDWLPFLERHFTPFLIIPLFYTFSNSIPQHTQ